MWHSELAAKNHYQPGRQTHHAIAETPSLECNHSPRQYAATTDNQPYSEHNGTRWHFALGACVAIATKPGHRLQICPIVHKEGTHSIPQLHPGPCSKQECGAGQTHRHTQTDRQTAEATIHFAWLCLMQNVITPQYVSPYVILNATFNSITHICLFAILVL